MLYYSKNMNFSPIDNITWLNVVKILNLIRERILALNYNQAKIKPSIYQQKKNSKY